MNTNFPNEAEIILGKIRAGMVFNALKPIENQVVFLSTLSVAFDKYCAHHGISASEADELADTLAEGLKQAHKEIGLPIIRVMEEDDG